MSTDTGTAMRTEAEALTLAQWFSPAYPVGGFHFSHGLEWAISSGAVSDGASLLGWIEQVLCNGSGRNDALLLAAAHGAQSDERLADLNALAEALAPSRERLSETARMGAAFARVTAVLLGQPLAAGCYPVVAGHAARLAGLPARLTARFYLHAFGANLVSVGMRLVPIGQTEGQRLIRDLMAPCGRVAEETAGGDLEGISSTAFLADIASMKHETQYSRIFNT